MRIYESDLKSIIENEIRSILTEQAMGINVDFYVFHVKQEYQKENTTVSKILPMEYIENIGGRWILFKRYTACCYVFSKNRSKVLSALNTWEIPGGPVLSQACKIKEIRDVPPENFDSTLQKLKQEA